MYKLLIAEGNGEFRQMLAQSLSREFTVRSCADGEAAEQLLLQFRPDLLVLDLMLPGIDGITLLHRMRQANICPTVLATLAYQSPFIHCALEKYGVAYYKMFSDDIQSLVNSLWEGLKTENSTELWVHITSITIVVAVLGYSGWNIYIKKKRSKFYRQRDKENKAKA